MVIRYLPYDPTDFAGGMENPSPSILAQDAIKELFQERYIYFLEPMKH
jgi:hypothetical protein